MPISLSLLSPSFPRLAASICSRVTRAHLQGVIFDMDGIDLTGMYKALYGKEKYKILSEEFATFPHKWSPRGRKIASKITNNFEEKGLQHLLRTPGLSKVCMFLESKNIGRGLITRNRRAYEDTIEQEFGIKFFPVLHRSLQPYKPDPKPLWDVCYKWNASPREVMVVGDRNEDVACVKMIGAVACLLDKSGRSYCGEVKTDYNISTIAEVQSLLERDFVLVP